MIAFQTKNSAKALSGILLVLIFLGSCKNKQATGSKTPKEERIVQNSNETPAPKQENTANPTIVSNDVVDPSKPETQSKESSDAIIRLLVSFYSVGGGIDIKTGQAFDNFISAYKTNSGKPITFERVPWGREGELDYCISFSTLSLDETSLFIEASKAKIKDCKMVHFKLNGECKRKR